MKKLLYFYTTWCQPCRYVNKNVIAPLENKIGSNQVKRINAQAEVSTSIKYGIDKLPTLVILDEGIEIKRYVGSSIDSDELEVLLYDKHKSRKQRE